MKKEYKKPLAEIVEFVPEDDIMSDQDVQEPDSSLGVEDF